MSTQQTVKLRDRFRKFAQKVASSAGSPQAFVISVTIVAAWALLGPTFHYSDTWQLVINTGTTIVTFLMVFLIQNTQNRDARALHLKLDELIRANQRARNELIDLESLSDEDLDCIQAGLRQMKSEAENRIEKIDKLIEQKRGRQKDRG